MRWLSIFLGMQTGHRPPSNDILLNYDLHEQAFYIYGTTATFFYNGNLQTGDKLKEKCLCKASASRKKAPMLPGREVGAIVHSFGVDGEGGASKSPTGARLVIVMGNYFPSQIIQRLLRPLWKHLHS